MPTRLMPTWPPTRRTVDARICVSLYTRDRARARERMRQRARKEERERARKICEREGANEQGNQHPSIRSVGDWYPRRAGPPSRGRRREPRRAVVVVVRVASLRPPVGAEASSQPASRHRERDNCGAELHRMTESWHRRFGKQCPFVMWAVRSVSNQNFDQN